MQEPEVTESGETTVRIAYLEDDPAQTEMVTMWLSEAGHQCRHFDTGKRFLADVRKETYDIAVLDWELPDMNGDEVLHTMRVLYEMEIPIICTTVRDEEENVVQALKLGADDYMTKPVSCQELLARLEALARRSHRNTQVETEFECPPFRFDVLMRRISRDGEDIPLTDKEFLLAKLMFQNIGRMLSRTFLLETVWGTRGDLDTRTVDTHVSRVRRKLQLKPDQGWRLTPIYKYGYRLERLTA